MAVCAEEFFNYKYIHRNARVLGRDRTFTSVKFNFRFVSWGRETLNELVGSTVSCLDVLRVTWIDSIQARVVDS